MLASSPRRLLGGLVLIALASCADAEGGAPSDSPVAVARQAIQGGTPVPGTGPVVAVVTATGSLCTGTLIAPNLVLTARHCVSTIEAESEFVDCDADRFGETTNPGRIAVTPSGTLSSRALWLRGESILVPGGSERVCGDDIALLVLAGSVPDDVATPLAPRLSGGPAAGESYEASGFGLTEETENGTTGQRLRIGGRLVQCPPGACGVTASEFVGDSGVCEGDSGGPAVDLDGEVIGVLSRGAVGCDSPVYTATTSFGEFLRQGAAFAADVAGTEPVAWAAGGGISQPTTGKSQDGVRGPTEVTEPKRPEDDGCTVAAVGSPGAAGEGGGALLGIGLLGLGLACRRRRQG